MPATPFVNARMPLIYCSLAGGNAQYALSNFYPGLRNVVATIRHRGANSLADQIVAAAAAPGDKLLKDIMVMQHWARANANWGNTSVYNPPTQVSVAGLNSGSSYGNNIFAMHPKINYAGFVAYDPVADGLPANSSTWINEGTYQAPNWQQYPTYVAQYGGPLSNLLACHKNLLMMLQCAPVLANPTAVGLVQNLANDALQLCLALDTFQPAVDAL